MPLQVVVVTPEKTALDQTCEFVAVPLMDGEAGIASGHAPTIGRLKAGEIRLKSDGKPVRYYVDGGFVQVNNDVVSVLTGNCFPVEELDLSAAQAALVEAQKLPSDNPTLADIKAKAVDQARAQITLAAR